MNIEALVKKHKRYDGINITLAYYLRSALTEQAEAFKGELQAYDGMVRELTKTVEDMRAAQSVPVAVNASHVFDNLIDPRGRAVTTEMPAVPVVGEPVAIVGEPIAILRREIGEDTWFDWKPVLPNSKTHQQLKAAGEMDYCEVYQRYTQSIPAAELATLREKAAMVDELRNRCARYAGLLFDRFGVCPECGNNDSHMESCPQNYAKVFKSPKDYAIAFAAIAQGKGE